MPAGDVQGSLRRSTRGDGKSRFTSCMPAPGRGDGKLVGVNGKDTKGGGLSGGEQGMLAQVGTHERVRKVQQ